VRIGTRFIASPESGAHKMYIDSRDEACGMAMYAGTRVGEVRAVQPAAEIVADLVALLP